MSEFTLSAPPNTDIWKKPPSTDVFNAPYRPHSKGLLTSFKSTTITFSAPYTTRYDQAGLLLTLTSPSSPRATKKWIKTGIEFYQSQPRISTVCCDTWADWSVASLPPGAPVKEIEAGERGVTIKVVSEGDENGLSFWVYYVPEDASGDLPLREICWVFGDNNGEGWELEVSAAVARPNKDVEGELEAKFSDFEVNWSSS